MHSNVRLVISFGIACVGWLATALFALPPPPPARIVGRRSDLSRTRLPSILVAVHDRRGGERSTVDFLVAEHTLFRQLVIPSPRPPMVEAIGLTWQSSPPIKSIPGDRSPVPSHAFTSLGDPWDYASVPIYRVSTGGHIGRRRRLSSTASPLQWWPLRHR